jgi:hypothetical protein
MIEAKAHCVIMATGMRAITNGRFKSNSTMPLTRIALLSPVLPIQYPSFEQCLPDVPIHASAFYQRFIQTQFLFLRHMAYPFKHHMLDLPTVFACPPVQEGFKSIAKSIWARQAKK